MIACMIHAPFCFATVVNSVQPVTSTQCEAQSILEPLLVVLWKDSDWRKLYWILYSGPVVACDLYNKKNYVISKSSEGTPK